MERIGIRDLRQRASRLVRRAAAGKSFDVAIPPASGQGIERLCAEGRTTPARREPLDDPPLQPKPGVPLPSQILEAMRADER